MSYIKRLNNAFTNAPVLPITNNTKYVFFSDCHRGTGNSNDNFLKNSNCYFAALQYYYQNSYTYIEVGDGDELWENRNMKQIIEIHGDIFEQLRKYNNQRRLYMLYGNHDMSKKYSDPLFENIQIHEGLIFQPDIPSTKIYVTHGHQADYLNSVLWKLARFLVRYLWTPLERLGFLDPTSAAKNNTKKEKIENRYINYSHRTGNILMTGHTHRPTLSDTSIPYCNCGSCVHPKCITCIELCGYKMNLVKWCSSVENTHYFNNIYNQSKPIYPVYIKREIIASRLLNN